MKTVFARHGIPETLRTDNGPQFNSQQSAKFAKQYDFTHTTSSPHFPANNGQAEKTVQTVKCLLKDADDPPLALLSYRATCFPWCGKSPTEQLMGRNIHTSFSQTTTILIPQWYYLTEFKTANKSLKTNRRRILIIVTVSVTCHTFQAILMDRIPLVRLSEELKHPNLTLFKLQQEKYVEMKVNLILTLPQQTLNQLQKAVVLS